MHRDFENESIFNDTDTDTLAHHYFESSYTSEWRHSTKIELFTESILESENITKSKASRTNFEHEPPSPLSTQVYE